MDTAQKVIYPCEPATTEQLDEILQAILYRRGDTGLRRFVNSATPHEIRWEQVRHLRITGDTYVSHVLQIRTPDNLQRFYVNADGSWLLILSEMPHPENYFRYCSGTLKSLWITNTEISALPGLGNLTQLTSLNLRDCRNLTQLPGLGYLTQLTSLNLYLCSALTQLPGLSNLTQLTSLNLRSCHSLTQLPGLGNLTRLSTLNLTVCSSLNQLPGLGNLTQLTSLNLNGCEFLTTLNLSRCISLTELLGLSSLTRLTTLDISGCSALTQLQGLGSLTQLTTLDISGCSALTQLQGLDDLTQLTSLNISGCTSLTTLDISGCTSLTELPGLSSLTQLNSLTLSRCESLNQLSDLDNLKRLTSLDISGCRFLNKVPEGIRDLSSLRRLNLRHLKLSELPVWLPDIAEDFSLAQWATGKGKNKAVVYLHGTTVEDMPDMSIFQQPYEVVAEWFEHRRLGQTHPLNEIKVVFLGDGEAGKSHTIARLMNDGGEPDLLTFDGESTPGIVIRNKQYDLDDRRITVHYWDFGGQEIMHSMHRIFLTKRTLYVILLNARDDTQSDRAKYWLHNVKSFAPDAPVLLVLNKIDQNENASVDEVDLRSRYDKLTQVVRLSALKYSQEEFNCRFTEVLLKEIENTGYLDAEWPASWTKVKERLENMTSHYILGDVYEDICKECSVARNQKELLHWFNDLGVSFCWDDKEADYALEEYVILRPDWITNGLYIILFNALEGTRNGVIPHSAIYDILKNAHKNPLIRRTLSKARYNTGDIGYVLGIMRKFNLSFTDGQNNEFIPMLCQQNSMVDIQYYHKDADTLEFNMEFDYLPNNLLHRLMVERHTELDMENVWRTGARFVYTALGYSAVVVIDGNILRFFIRHSDPMHRPNTYLTMLKAHVDRIVANMGLKTPSCKLVYKLDGKRDEFDYEDVKLNRELGDITMTSKAHRKKIFIEDILNQSAPDGLEDEMRLLNGIRSSCRSIQADPIYRLIKNASGSGSVNGQGMEDQRNRRIRDDLGNMEFLVADQTQRGSSSTGVSIGELDMLLLNQRGEPWTIIEALRVSDGRKNEWNRHLKRLICDYNYFGARSVYLLTYVDADPADFDHIWNSYQAHIRTHDPSPYSFSMGSFSDLNDANSPRYIQAAKCQYSYGGDCVTVYHIFAQIPTKNG